MKAAVKTEKLTPTNVCDLFFYNLLSCLNFFILNIALDTNHTSPFVQSSSHAHQLTETIECKFRYNLEF